MGVTTAYELGLSDKKPTAEEIAADINSVNEWLADPVNNLVSRIEGHVYLKRDTIMCIEKCYGLRKCIDKEATWGPIPMTDLEEREVHKLKEDVDLFEIAIDMIKELRNEN